MTHTLFTIGYAGKGINDFIACLKKHEINCVIDVRTSPFSKTFPAFDKPKLKEALKKENISYGHFGNEFGARRVENEAYEIVHTLYGEAKEQVSFRKVYELPEFRKGVERIINAARMNYNVCFLCSEKHPIDCHRFWMVAYYFATLTLSFEIVNIIDENNSQNYLDVIEEAKAEFEKGKKKFYKEHDELNGCSLVNLDIPKWVKEWDGLFNSKEHEHNVLQKFFNIKIGYSKGANEYD